MHQTDERHWHNHQGHCIDQVGSFTVIACETCQFKHVIPLPSDEELTRIYQHEYYSQEKPLYLERYQEDLPWWNGVYQERYEQFEQQLPVGCRRILDVGSGPGYFLLLGKQRGWDAVGIEPSQRAAEHSRNLGLTIIEQFLTASLAETLGKFDVINLGEVLEHIPHPDALLKTIASLLVPGGLICVIVPNDYNPFQMAVAKTTTLPRWWIAPPHHLNYFNFDSLSALLARHGLNELSRQATFPIDIFLLMGDHYIGDDTLGRSCHRRRMQLEKSLDKAGSNVLKQKLYQSFAALDIGREVQIIAQKPLH